MRRVARRRTLTALWSARRLSFRSNAQSIPSRAYPPGYSPRGDHDGWKVQQRRSAQGGEGDEGAQERHAEERPLRKEGEEPQASNCHWTLRGPSGRQEGAEKEEYSRFALSNGFIPRRPNDQQQSRGVVAA